MNKKVILCYLLCFLVLLSLTACADDPAPVLKQEEGTSAPTEEQKPNSNADHPIEPPVVVYFDSINEIGEFFFEEKNDPTDSSIEPSEESIYLYETQSEAEKLAETVASVKYPVADVKGGLCYHPYREEDTRILKLSYNVDGIPYRFVYAYDLHSAYTPEEEPAYSNVQIGPYTMDLYRTGTDDYPFLFGSTVINGFRISVRIKVVGGEEKFDFSKFEFVSLSDVSEDEVA